MRETLTRDVHNYLADVLGRVLTNEPVRCIWDVGSRDGRDGYRLLRCFPDAHIHCFEPNRDTFGLVQATCEQSDVMHPLPYALGDVDGLVSFQKIDVRKSQSLWPDGNPGASSFFRASGAYDEIEAYTQDEVEVACRRAQSLIESGEVCVPDLVWMDVQGAEGIVLSGFGPYLTRVKAIFLEVSRRAIYDGQPFAGEVL